MRKCSHLVVSQGMEIGNHLGNATPCNVPILLAITTRECGKKMGI